VTVRPALPHLVALMLGAGAALLASCGTSTNLIPASHAAQLNTDLQAVSDAVDNHDCADAASADEAVASDVTGLPVSVDPRLRIRLAQGTALLTRRLPEQCTSAPVIKKPVKKKKPTKTTTTAATTVATTTAEPTTSTVDTTTEPTLPTTATTTSTPTTPTSTNGGVITP
jgi:hypothetical protein